MQTKQKFQEDAIQKERVGISFGVLLIGEQDTLMQRFIVQILKIWKMQ